jgi:hypothetical protein
VKNVEEYHNMYCNNNINMVNNNIMSNCLVNAGRGDRKEIDAFKRAYLENPNAAVEDVLKRTSESHQKRMNERTNELLNK